MLTETAQQLRQKLEAILWKHFLTEEEVFSIRKALSCLAFNMTLNGVNSAIDYSIATAWLYHVRQRKLYRRPQPPRDEIEQANPIWSRVMEAKLLTLSDQGIGFAAPEFQAYFCFLYCAQKSLDLSLLRLIAIPNFSEMWRLWIALDETLIGRFLNFAQLPYKRARFRAVKILGFLRLVESFPILLSSLHDPFPSVRWQSAFALGEIADARAALPLTQLIDDPIREVRWQASIALGKLGADALDALLPQLAVDNAETCWRISKSFHMMGYIAVEPLLSALRDESPIVRRNTAFVLQAFQDERLVPPLLNLLTDLDDTVRLNAVKALYGQKSSAILIPLIQSLHDANSEIRRYAAFSLGNLGDTEAVEPILALLNDSDKLVRIAATSALAMLKDNRAVLPLIAALNDKQIDYAAATALGDLADNRALRPLIAVIGDCGNALIALRRFDQGAVVQALLDAVDPYPTPQYFHVLIALGDTADPRAVSVLLRALSDPRPGIRAAVPFRLAFFDDSRVRRALINALHDEDAEVRYLAVYALGRSHDNGVTSTLVPLLKDTDRRVRLFTLSALRELSDTSATEALLNTLNDNDADVRTQAAALLGELGDYRALRLLQAVNGYETNRTVRVSAIRAINRIKERLKQK